MWRRWVAFIGAAFLWLAALSLWGGTQKQAFTASIVGSKPLVSSTGWASSRGELMFMHVICEDAGATLEQSSVRLAGTMLRINRHERGTDVVGSVPWWLAMIVVTILPALAWRDLVRGRRFLREFGYVCERCGYDLRASQGQCPECGTEIPRVTAPGDALNVSIERARAPSSYWTRILRPTAILVVAFALFMLVRLIAMLDQLPGLTLVYRGGYTPWPDFALVLFKTFDSLCGVLMGIAAVGVLKRRKVAEQFVGWFAISMLLLELLQLFCPPFNFWQQLEYARLTLDPQTFMSVIDASVGPEFPRILMLSLIAIIMIRGRSVARSK